MYTISPNLLHTQVECAHDYLLGQCSDGCRLVSYGNKLIASYLVQSDKDVNACIEPYVNIKYVCI